MKIKVLASAVAVTSLAFAGGASAQVVGGAVGGTVGGAVNQPGGTVGGTIGATGAGRAAAPTAPGVTTPPVNRPPVTTPPVDTPPVSLPDAPASARASANANANAGAVSANAGASLDTLAAGMAVRDASGRAIGKVSRVLRTASGKVQSVEVAGNGGKTINLAPGNLSLSGGVVTTSEASAGTN